MGNGGRYDGPTPPLTGSAALDLADLAALAADLLGRPVRREVITDAELQSRLASRGLPQGAQALTLGLYVASRNGEFSALDPMLAGLLGRAPLAMRDILAEAIAAQAA
jgi:NAD(P)H dehydrogenase (quinone)